VGAVMQSKSISQEYVRLPSECLCGMVWTCGLCYVAHMWKTHKVVIVHRPADAELLLANDKENRTQT
jgi:hypothetical protein